MRTVIGKTIVANFVNFKDSKIQSWNLLHHMCAECEGAFHVAGVFHDVGLGGEVVEHVDDDGLLRTRFHGRAEFEFSVVGQDDVHDMVDFRLRHLFLLEVGIQSVGGDEDVPEQVFVVGCLAVFLVFIHFSVVMEEYAYDASLYFYLIGQTGVQSFEHVQHLVGVVEQSALKGVVDVCSCGFFRIGVEEFVGVCPSGC